MKPEKTVLDALYASIDDLKREVERIKANPEYLRLPEEPPGALITHSNKWDQETLNLMKNIVYTKRVSGHIHYSQTRALKDAFRLLGQTMTVMERPNSVKEVENDRAAEISRGINKKKEQPDKASV